MKRKLMGTLLFITIMILSSRTVLADTAAFKFSDGVAKPGDLVTIDLSLVNNPGIASFTFELIYDESIMEWVGIKEGNLDGIWDTEIGRSITWVSADNYMGNKDILSVTFKIKDDAASGETEISLSYDADDVFNENEENVFFSVIPGHIDIKGGGAEQPNTEKAEGKPITANGDSNIRQDLEVIPSVEGNKENTNDGIIEHETSDSEEQIGGDSALVIPSGQADGSSLTEMNADEDYSTEESTTKKGVDDLDENGNIAESKGNDTETVNKKTKDEELSNNTINNKSNERHMFLLAAAVASIMGVAMTVYIVKQKRK